MLLEYRNGNMLNFTQKCQLFINVVPFYSYFSKGFILNLEGMFKFIKHLQYTTKMTGIFSPPLEIVKVANYIS